MSEITDKGYVVKTQNEWFEEERQLYLDIDPEWNLDPSTPDGLKIAHDAEIFGNLDEVLQRAYTSKDPNSAQGLELDIIGALTFAFRKPGTPSQAVVTLSGNVGTLVGQGTRIESKIDGTQWTTDQTVTIGAGGTVDAGVTCTILGAIQADPDSLTRIVDTVGGLQSCTNALAATAGTEEETDTQFKVRRAKSVGLPGTNQIDNMLAIIGAVDGTRRFIVYENFTGSAAVDPVFNPHGLPAHSIAVIVDGGTDEDVALAIFRKKNPGCQLYAAGTPVVVPDVFDLYPQNKKTITFSRPIYVDITVAVEVINDGTLPNNAGDLIKQSILYYTGGTLLDPSCGFNTLGFDINEDVPISRMYTPVNQVIGQYGNSYINTITLNGGGTNVTIEFNELAKFTEANINVVIS